jgi:hypothetical protein
LPSPILILNLQQTGCKNFLMNLSRRSHNKRNGRDKKFKIQSMIFNSRQQKNLHNRNLLLRSSTHYDHFTKSVFLFHIRGSSFLDKETKILKNFNYKHTKKKEREEDVLDERQFINILHHVAFIKYKRWRQRAMTSMKLWKRIKLVKSYHLLNLKKIIFELIAELCEWNVMSQSRYVIYNI